MEPGRVELPSALGFNFPLFHRFSHAVPYGGVYQLALTDRLSGVGLELGLTRGSLQLHPLG